MHPSTPWLGLAAPSATPTDNVAFAAHRIIELPAEPRVATLRILADTFYRLYVNGEWIADGPAREWPGRARYDELDVAHALRPGLNVVAAIVRFFPDSSFHRVPQHPGLRLQLDVTHLGGLQRRFVSDRTWLVRPYPALRSDTARTCIQQHDGEWFDARLDLPNLHTLDGDPEGWSPACVWPVAESAPCPLPRDIPMLTRRPVFPRRLVHAVAVAPCAEPLTFSTKRFCYPDNHDANHLPMAGAFATVLVSDADREVEVYGAPLHINGQAVKEGRVRLLQGDNLLVLGFAMSGHQYTVSFGFRERSGLAFRSPIDDSKSPWGAVGPFEPLPPDRKGPPNAPGRCPPCSEAVRSTVAALCQCPDAATFRAMAGDALRPLPPGVLRADVAASFGQRRPLAPAVIERRDALFAEPHVWTTLPVPASGNLELMLDLGDQSVGHLAFELDAPYGTVVHAAMIEYQEDGRLQLTGGMCNCFRYIARQGVQSFISFVPRSGRYLFLTFRDVETPVRLRNVRLLENTYPVERTGDFACSDAALNRIWDISVRTLQLCMLDTYVDCPLYEQTLWVGDARNEALYAHVVFGAYDLTRRCLRLSAESLDRLPLVGAQVPSGWDTILPAWSFLWGIGVWDYYRDSGDRETLAAMFPAVLENLRRAESFCSTGLFSMAAWNLFDWSGADQSPATVVHNTQFLIGAIDAARRCAAALDRPEDDAAFAAFAGRLRSALLPLWNSERGSYPDAIRDDGSVSPSICQHTSALGLLYDTLPDGTHAIALRNLLDPPDDMVRFGSPFATQYLFEALEKAGAPAAESLALIRRLWQDMLDSGATTVWETFRPANPKAFPTRSHCHAWSSAPIDVFTRLLLGIRFAAPGGSEIVVSPRPAGLAWARGTVATPHGPFSVSWKLVADRTISLRVDAPPGVAWRFEPNAEVTTLHS